MEKIRKNKKRDVILLLMSISIVVLLNFIGSFAFHRFDLTSEKRYTLSDATKKLLKDLDDVVYVKVYLEGEFPAGFKRLRDETKEMLDEFRAYSNNNIEYEFINPSENPDKNQREAVYKQLYEKGLQPTNLEVKEEDGTSQQIIFPAAIVTFKGRDLPWQLLKTQTGTPPEEVLNNSVQALEYELSNTIRKLNTVFQPKLAFIEGHHELDSLSVKDITETLKEYYEVKRIEIKEQLHALDGLKAIVIAKPDSAFTEKDKFIIDQFIMKGGRVLWLIDPVYVGIDSLRATGNTMGLYNPINLDDQLFKYGVRINPNLILDIQSAFIPVNKAFVGQPPKFELVPWFFSPLIMPSESHPIVKNLDLIKFEFTSSIDTVSVKEIKKTILLRTSKYTKLIATPARVSLAMVNMKPKESQFRQSFQPVAVLLEGKFESVYKNRISPQLTENIDIGFKEKSPETKMIVISDGDAIKNEVQRSTGRAFPLGYDVYTKQTYGNKNFILNCINYLCDDSGLMAVRARELKLRLLDRKKTRHERLKWQIVNTVLPVLAIILFGFVQFFIRKRKYAR